MTRKRHSKQGRGQRTGRGTGFQLGRLGFLLAVTGVAGAYGASACFGLPAGGSAVERRETVGFLGPIVLMVNPGEPARSANVETEFLGVDPNQLFKVFIADTEAQVEPLGGEGGPLRVRLSLHLINLEAGSYEVRVEQGDQSFTNLKGFHVIPRPSFEDVVCGGGVPWRPEGDRLVLDVPELPEGFGWLVKSGDTPLKIIEYTSTDYKLPVDLEPLSGASMDISIQVLSHVGTALACDQQVRRGSGPPQIDVARLDYDSDIKTLRLRLEGTALPTVVNLLLDEGGQGIPLEAVEGAAQAKRYEAKVAKVLQGETTVEVRHEGQLLHQSFGRWSVERAERWQFREFKSPLDLELADLAEEIVPNATTTIAGADYPWVKVQARSYSLGLSPKQRLNPVLARQNLADPSSSPNGRIELRLGQSFLIGINEVTQAQFHTYLREARVPDEEVPATLRAYRSAELPAELANLPVTRVSYIAARHFVTWLQSNLSKHTDRWRVRLPHEVEWEMAARGGDTVDYAFLDQNLEEGLRSLNHPGPRPVGSNRWDRSLVGVHDMTGNVREWTQTPYEERLLELLEFHLNSGNIDVWDPAEPYGPLFAEIPDEDLGRESLTVTIRGAANGESNDLFYLLALRQRKEWSKAYEDVGFRLVLVPTRGL